MTISDGHRLLRDGTRHLHDRTEAVFSGLNLCRRPDYGAFLYAQAAAVLPLEAWMDAHAGGTLPDWPARRRGTLLLGDLDALGIAPPPTAPIAWDDGHPVGVAYVLEGSRLGAAMLARQAATGADPAVRAAMGFLGAPRDAAAWKGLLARVDLVAAAPGGADALLAGANAAFLAFEALARAAIGTPERVRVNESDASAIGLSGAIDVRTEV